MRYFIEGVKDGLVSVASNARYDLEDYFTINPYWRGKSLGENIPTYSVYFALIIAWMFILWSLTNV